MTSWVVADSSILLATVLKETHSELSKSLLRSWNQAQLQLAAPTLFCYEIVSVMRKSVYQRRLTPDEATTGLRILLAQPVRLLMDDTLLKRGYELAGRFNRPTAYDSQYLAIAEHLGCEFWTADERLYNAVNQDLSWVRWIHQWTEE